MTHDQHVVVVPAAPERVVPSHRDGAAGDRTQRQDFSAVGELQESIAFRVAPAPLVVVVAFVPGRAFHADGTNGNTLRLSFSLADAAAIEEGIARLGRLIAGVARAAA